MARYGEAQFTSLVRQVVAELRGDPDDAAGADLVAVRAMERASRLDRPSQRRVLNLTGTVLHTNLGRAVLAETAIEAAVRAMRHPTNLEYDVEGAGRGERDQHVVGLLKELTGADDAVIVNNNAAAVFLVLNTLAKRKSVVVSRGELVEIGGAFRMPDIMAQAGVRMVEVGTTNRTHRRDYEGAIDGRTALIVKVHTSNYEIRGFTADVPGPLLAATAHGAGLPLFEDLGSGTLTDLSRFGIRRERTVQEAIRDGADIVTFSGDKLLGGPQIGIAAGRVDLIARLRKNPLKRVLRADKIRLAALEATLRLYRNAEALPKSLPTLRVLARSREEIRAMADRLVPALERRLSPDWTVAAIECESQVGSGALPIDTIPSIGIAMTPAKGKRGAGYARLAQAFRDLPVPCIGRAHKKAYLFDLRTLDDEELFLRQLGELSLPG